MNKIKEHSGLIKEFKEFISRGSVMDLAVGIIIGSAFTAIVNSLVKDIIMPVIGLLIGKINFENLQIVLSKSTDGTVQSAITYGTFIQNIVNFLIIAFVVFLMVKGLNGFKRKKATQQQTPAEPAVPDDVKLLTEIRDLLKK